MTPLDIIIVNFNTKADVSACLASLHAAPPSRPHHICVVDNASQDGSVDSIRAQWPHIDVVALPTNVGFAAANNVGIRRTRAPLVLLNSDTLVPPTALDRLVERLDATGATAIGPRLVDADGRPEVSWGPMLSPLGEARQWLRVSAARSHGRLARWTVSRALARERAVDWVSGACLLVTREAAEAAGLLDERYFMYEEDVDFCAALRARGGTIVFTPAVEVTHLRGRSVATTRQGVSPLYDRSHLRFYQKHAPHWAPLLRVWLALRGRAIR